MKAWLTKAFYFGIVTCLYIVVVETALFLLIPAPQIQPGHHGLFCQYDPLLGWSKIPNKVGMFRTREYNVEEKMNSRGLRGAEHAYAKPASTFRILMLGDSFLEAYSVDLRDSVSELLKSKLKDTFHGKDVEAINAGTGGYSTDQEYLFFKEEGNKYRPDAVVVFFYQNDVYYNVRDEYPRAPKPLLVWDGSQGLSLTNYPVPKAPRGAWKQFVLSSVQPSLGWLTSNSFLFNRLSILWTRSSTGKSVFPAEYSVYLASYPAEISHAWLMTERILSELKREVQSAGGELILFYVPSRVEVENSAWSQVLKYYRINEEKLVRDRIEKEIGSIAHRLKIPLINPTDVFRKKSETGKKLYYPADGHWNKEGHEQASKMLAAYFESED